MINIYIVGCGGIGGYLVDLLPMALAGLSLDLLREDEYDVTTMLEQAGTRAIPCVADSITLIDGDAFNARNALRQGAGTGSKLSQRMRMIKTKLAEMGSNNMLMASWLHNLRVTGYNCYLTPDNMEKIIPRNPPDNPGNAEAAHAFPSLLRKQNATVVFLCVDNKKTRYEVSKYMEQFDDCLVINGGNSKTAGQVTVYERENGVALDPNIYEVFPDVNETADKRPDELECTAVAPEHDQIANTNAIIGTWMSVVLNNWLRYGLSTTTVRGDVRVVTRTNEIMVDTKSYATMGLFHPVPEKPKETYERQEEPGDVSDYGQCQEGHDGPGRHDREADAEQAEEGL